MATLNKATLIGRLGKDPELKYTPSGSAVCNFSMATTESYTDKNGSKQEMTQWHNIVVWAKTAEMCHQYLKKGSQVFIEGSLQTRSWDDKDGKKCYKTEINAKNVQFLESKQQENQVRNSNEELAATANYTVDDVPF